MDSRQETTNCRLFSRVAPWYDSRFPRLLYFDRIYRRLLELLDRDAGQKLAAGVNVIDVGCGTGEVINRLARRYPKSHYTGIDLTPRMLERARHKTSDLEHVSWVVGSASRLLFPEASFAVAVCSEAFHHFPEPQRSLSEIYRVLMPGGCLFLVDPAFNRPWLKRLGTWVFPRLEHAHAVYSTEDLRVLLAQQGFQVRHSSTHALNSFVFALKAVEGSHV